MRLASMLGIVILLLTASAQSALAATGPELVRDLGPNELVQTFVPIGNSILFTADDGIHGRELFVSDGTFAGTHMVSDIRPGAGSSMLWSSGDDNPNSFVSVGDHAFFLANDGAHGVGLYVSDGTSAGTLRLMRRRPCADDASNELVAAGNRLVFAARDTSGTCNLYSTDGTTAGTMLVQSNIGAFHQPRYLGSHVFFAAGDADTQLWRTTALVGAAAKRVKSFDTSIHQMTVTGNRLYFTTGIPDSTESRLWKSDGTQTGTKLVRPAAPLIADDMAVIGNKLVFEVLKYEGNGVWDSSLWRTNGNPSGTRMLTDFGTDKYSSVSAMWPAGDRVFMLAGTDLHTYGLWLTDGSTSAGTGFVAKVDFFNAVSVGSDIYGPGCYRDDTTVPVGCGSGPLLMTSDGTLVGSHDIPGAVNLLGDITVAGGTVFMNVNGQLYRYEP